MLDPLLRALYTVLHFIFTILCGLGTSVISTMAGGHVMGKGTCPLGNLNPGFPSDVLHQLHKMFVVNRLSASDCNTLPLSLRPLVSLETQCASST